MMTWQIVMVVVLALLPFALLADLHPNRERLDARGRPLQRDWERQLTRTDAGADHH